jgi:hypothetical protein
MSGNRPWDGKSRPPIGQYDVHLVITGDDIGPAALGWLIERMVSTHGHTAFIQTIEPTRRGPAANNVPEHNPSRAQHAVAEALRHALALIDAQEVGAPPLTHEHAVAAIREVARKWQVTL